MSPPASPPPSRILVVDDDAQTRQLLQDICGQLGHAVRQAADGVEALESVAEELPDLVLLDLMMPRKDGYEVLAALRAEPRTRSLPVILLTAQGDMTGKLRGMELGANDFLTKPFRLFELQARMNSLLLVHDLQRKYAAMEDELSQLRPVDPQTGAATYGQLKASLDSELARAKRYERPVSVLMLGLHDYGGLRYGLGKAGCDALLADLAKAVSDTLRGADRLFRMDLNNFVVLLPETDLAGARATARRLSDRVLALPVKWPTGTAHARIRVGGAAFPSEGTETGEDLLREAHRVYLSLRDAPPDRLVF